MVPGRPAISAKVGIDFYVRLREIPRGRKPHLRRDSAESVSVASASARKQFGPREVDIGGM
jgi:hypothetical protein